MRKISVKTAACLALLLTLAAPALSASQAWQKDLDSRTALIWVDAQFLGKMVLNARARLFITWLPQSLRRRLDGDRDVDEWVVNGLGYYYSTDPETKARMKGHDVLALNYHTEKSWSFDPTELVVGDYHVTAEDILGHPELRGVTGDLPSGVDDTLFIRVPSLKPGRTVTVTLGPDSAALDLPKR